MPTCFLRPLCKALLAWHAVRGRSGFLAKPWQIIREMHTFRNRTTTTQQTKKSLILGNKQHHHTTIHHVTLGSSAQTPFE